MNSGELFIFLVIMIFGTYSIQQDIKDRKVDNFLNLFLFIVSFIIFIFATPKLLFEDFLTLILVILISYYIYYKHIWGGADGKIFISICFMLTTINGYSSIINYLINLIIFYTLTLIILSILKTSIKDKKKVLLNIEYKKDIFITLLVFVLTSFVFPLIPKSLNSNISLLILISTFMFLFIFISKFKKFFDKFDEDSKIIIDICLFAILVLFSHKVFLNYFFPILFLKLFIEYSSKITEKIKNKNQEYNSPFTIYLFIVALFSILLSENVVLILLKLFMN